MLNVAWLADLWSEEAGGGAFGSFCRGIALSSRFQLSLIFGDTEGTAAALLLLEKQVAALQRRSVQVVDLLPEQRLSYDATVGAEGVPVSRVIAALLKPQASVEQFRVLLINGSADAATNLGPWVELFERMNQQRNQIMAQSGCPLLLCLPPGREADFANAAPDFWSVRGRALTLPRLHEAAPMSSQPQRLVYIAAAADADLVHEFEAQLAPLESVGLIDAWSESRVRPGELLDIELSRRLASAEVVLFFMSPALLEGTHYLDLIERASHLREQQGHPITIPVLLRPVHWQQTALGKWRPLPRSGDFVGQLPAELRAAVWNHSLGEIMEAWGRSLPEQYRLRTTDPASFYSKEAYERGVKDGERSGAQTIGLQSVLALLSRYAEMAQLYRRLGRLHTVFEDHEWLTLILLAAERAPVAEIEAKLDQFAAEAAARQPETDDLE